MAKSILVVEDSLETRQMYATALEHAGFIVFEAHDGLDGIVKAAEHVPTLVLLDIGLPKLDGWDVCRALNRDPHTADIKIVVLTAYPFLPDDSRSSGCITAGFITKPATPMRVLEEIIRLIGPP